MTKRPKSKKNPTLKFAIVIRGLILIFTLLSLAFLIEATPLSTLMDKVWIDNQVKGQGLSGKLLFISIGTLITAVGLPKQAVGFFGGYAFGMVIGTGLAVLATLFGCIFSFYYSRFLARDFIRKRYRKRVKKVDKFIHENPLGMTLLIRLLPVGNNLLTNLAAGASAVKGLPFFIGSMIGYIPQTLVFALIGSGVNINPVYRISLGIMLFIVSGLLGIALYRKYRHGNKLDKNTEKQLY